MLTVPTQPVQELRKSIYSKQNNPQQKRWFLDTIGDKIGSENVAYIMMAFSTCVFPLGFLYPNQHNFKVCQTFLVRSIAVIAINVFIARYFHMDITFKDPTNFRLLFIRNFCITIQGIMFTLAQFYLTQPIVQTINTTGFLFVFVMDYLINRVTITRKQFYGVILGVVGVLITVNGEFIIKKINPDFQTHSDFKNYLSDDPIVKLTVALLFIGGNIMWAYAQIITKRIHGMNAIQINVHLGFFFMFATGVVYPTQVQKSVQIPTFLMGIIMGGVIMTIGQITFIGATTMTKNTGVLTMFGFVSVIMGYIVSIYKYNEAVNPVCIAGAGFILLGLTRIVFKDKVPETAQIYKQMKQVNNK